MKRYIIGDMELSAISPAQAARIYAKDKKETVVIVKSVNRYHVDQAWIFNLGGKK